MVTRFRQTAGVLLLLVVLALSVGCRTTTQRLPLPVAPEIVDVSYPSVEKTAIESLASAMNVSTQPSVRTRPLEVLALTGGVSGAPYISGMLVGWTKSGTRPTFDVVTGISSGALISMYAFLGPKYDADLERLILSLHTSDFFNLSPARCIREGSLGSCKPGERLMQREITRGVIDDLRQAHAEGRRFFVGTMNVETRRLVVWDLGAVASSGRPDADDLVRKVMLATFAWPGFVPPVEITVEVNGKRYTEQHYDGGSTGMMFLRFGPLADWPNGNGPARPGWLAGSNLYLLANRKLFAEPAPVARKTMARTVASVTAMFEAYSRSEMCRLHAFCAASGMRFHLMSEPADHPGSAPTFGDLFPRDARPLFDSGFQMGAAGPRWRHTPPGAEPGEESIPRDGSNVVSFR